MNYVKGILYRWCQEEMLGGASTVKLPGVSHARQFGIPRASNWRRKGREDCVSANNV